MNITKIGDESHPYVLVGDKPGYFNISLVDWAFFVIAANHDKSALNRQNAAARV